ncbi:family 20 glycosylhydrolase [Asticcacaulis sp. 201]|uniref:family 20 glycosylhydrolase n=1 Tax=Asticcacaulis sp. 201 TaxID=3028787 RepID=UPI002915C7F8|nr:family 20 glycosylhydrolase [Asticcacaulis sp. 201]MDV6331595.1 family 20 glycosylhydrolase [Asticcacaulis sp. 201]
MSTFIRSSLFAATLLATTALVPGISSATTQAQLDSFANTLGYKVSNDAGRTRIDITLPKSLPDGAWSLYFGSVSAIAKADSDQFDLTHINGDNFRVTPKPGVTLTPGATYTIYYPGVARSEYQAMPNAYIVADGLAPRTIAATRTKFDPQSGLEYLPFVAPMAYEAISLTPERAFALNATRQVAQAKPDIVILPTPLAATHLEGKPLPLSGGIRIAKLDGGTLPDIKAALDAGRLRLSKTGVPVEITIDGQGKAESYHLIAQDGKITITAADAAGAAYALTSLGQQAAYEHNRLKPLEISDAPRFGFRGLHIDLARNFHSKAFILATIDQMAEYKLNRLHLHLGDDEGWRLAIKPLPELTEIGSHRCHDLSEDKCLLPQLGAGPQGSQIVDGYLTRADYIEIVQIAAAHHIEVIPSFDMPGHSRAAVRSMEARYRRLMAEGKPEAANEFRLQDPDDKTVYSSIQHYNDNTLNICIPSTYHFIDTVIDDIQAMHREAGVPLKIYHIGADETAGAWTNSPACQALIKEKSLTPEHMTPYFITQVSQMLGKKGIEPAGWSDGMGHVKPEDMPKVVQSNSWGGLFTGGVAEAYRQANRGWDIVISTPEVLYFDMPYAPDPKERGMDWASRGTDLFKVFAFMPENLVANASLMTDLQARGQTIADTEPLESGRKITGIQGQLWSEGVRTDSIADYLIYPRTLALAERAWHTGSWEPAYVAGRAYHYGDGQIDYKGLLSDWQNFNDRLAPRLANMEAAGIAYRLPAPGARITGGVFEANLAYGDLAIQYRTTGGKWTAYRGPVAVKGPVETRSVAPNGKRFSRIVSVQ